METEIQATEKFLQNYRTTGYDSAATSAVEIAQELDIDPSFPPSRSGKKRRLFDYQGEEEQRATPELKFKSNFFYPLVDQAIMSIKERFNPRMHTQGQFDPAHHFFKNIFSHE